MVFRTTIIFAVLSQVTAVDCACGVSFQTESVEWKTDRADIVVVGKVVGSETLPPENSVYDSQTVRFRITQSIKGRWSGIVSFRQDYRNMQNASDWYASKINDGDRIVVFLEASRRQLEVRVADWFNLSSPIEILADCPTPCAPYDNDCKGLASEAEILKVVRERAAVINPPERGLIIEFPFQPLEEGRGYSHRFLMTAEEKYKQRFVDELQSDGYMIRESAACNLASYPDDETERLLRSLLSDPSHLTMTLGPSDIETVSTYYPVREAAYHALLIIGAKVDPPEGYLPSNSTRQLDSNLGETRYDWSVDWNPSHFFDAWLAPHLLLAVLPPVAVYLHRRRWRFTIRDLALAVVFVCSLLALCAQAFAVLAAGDDIRGELIAWFSSSAKSLGLVLLLATTATIFFANFGTGDRRPVDAKSR